MKKIVFICTVIAVVTSVASGKVIRRQLNIFQSSVPETEILGNEKM